jgi:hypothetical protein
MKFLSTIRHVAIVITTFLISTLCVSTVNAAELSQKEQEDLYAYEIFVDFWNVPPTRWYGTGTELDKIGISHLFRAKDLSIFLLDRSNTKTALRALAYMDLLGLDGGLSEIHSCVLLKKGKAILPFLLEAQKSYAPGKCTMPDSSVTVAKGRCGDSETVNRALRLSIEGIKAGEKC